MKKNVGFTLIEVLIAMAILTSAILIVSNLELRSFLRIARDRDEIEKIFLLKQSVYNVLLKAQNEKFKNKDIQKLEKPELSITTVIEEIPPKSSLKDYKDKLRFVKVQGTWKRDGYPQEMVLTAVMLRPLDEKEKGKL
jgi:prepilin-type N-terminal cleavage/methylation domain-containing protein